MEKHTENRPSLTPAAKKRALFERQKALLDTFLANGAIDRRQYDKSLGCLREKMGFPEDSGNPE